MRTPEKQVETLPVSKSIIFLCAKGLIHRPHGAQRLGTGGTLAGGLVATKNKLFTIRLPSLYHVFTMCLPPSHLTSRAPPGRHAEPTPCPSPAAHGLRPRARPLRQAHHVANEFEAPGPCEQRPGIGELLSAAPRQRREPWQVHGAPGVLHLRSSTAAAKHVVRRWAPPFALKTAARQLICTCKELLQVGGTLVGPGPMPNSEERMPLRA